MHKVQHNQLDFPGVCRICGSAPKEGQAVVDTEQEFYDNGDDVTGRVYVCDACVHAMADLLGYVHEKTFKWELAQLNQEMNQLRTFRDEVHQLMNPSKEKKIALA